MDRQQQLDHLLTWLNSVTDDDFNTGWRGDANQLFLDHYPNRRAEFLQIFNDYEEKHEMIAPLRRLLRSL